VSDEIDLEAMRRTRDETLPFFRSDAATLARSYAPGKWTMRQLLLHIVDTETVIFERLRRALAEDKPLVLGFDENRWVERLHYDRRSLATAETLYRATRDSAIELIEATSPAERAREAVHTEQGKRSFAHFAFMVRGHNAHHLEQVRAIAEGKPWQPRPATYAAAPTKREA
jgi:hypothetical protein